MNGEKHRTIPNQARLPEAVRSPERGGYACDLSAGHGLQEWPYHPGHPKCTPRTSSERKRTTVYRVRKLGHTKFIVTRCFNRLIESLINLFLVRLRDLVVLETFFQLRFDETLTYKKTIKATGKDGNAAVRVR